MWKDFDQTTYDRASFAAHVATLRWIAWKPIGLTIHNTGAPTLAQWAEAGPAHDQRILNLEHYYEDVEHWHAGPHLFISRSHISGFSDILAPGVHASCFNHTRIGIEMVGDYSTERFDDGDGALVRGMTAFAAATLLHALALPADASTINFHRDCAADHHACPGKFVDKAAMISRIAAAMPGGQP